MGLRRGHGASHIQNLLKIDPTFNVRFHGMCRANEARTACGLSLRVTAVLLLSDGFISPPGSRGGVTYFRR